MAEQQGINAICAELNQDYQELFDIMQDMSDTNATLNGKIGDYEFTGEKASDPGTMFKVAASTSALSIKDGGLADFGMKPSQIQKMIAQKTIG